MIEAQRIENSRGLKDQEDRHGQLGRMVSSEKWTGQGDGQPRRQKRSGGWI